MIFTNTITLILALAPATLFAAPTQTVTLSSALIAARGIPAKALEILEDGNCDLSSVKMPTAPTPLPAPSEGLRLIHVALGRGSQNYTCASNSADVVPVQLGAWASLYNATCSSVRAPQVLADATALALLQPLPSGQVADRLLSGHHEFTEKKVPLFKLQTTNTDYGYVQAKPSANSTAPSTASTGPNGRGSVPWLKLAAVEGDYKEVYRVDTAGGVAPKTCEGLEGVFTVEYSAMYYFWA